MSCWRKNVIGEERGTLICGNTAVLSWWCPETEVIDEGCCVILKGQELGEGCAKLGVEGGDSISASSMWMSVLG